VLTFELSPGVVHTDMTAGMPMHDARTEWTAVQDVVSLAVAIARGRLDAWSGRFVRAVVDTVESLAAATEEGHARGRARRLLLHPYGPGDPLAR
jgi:hypothetical protein